MSDALDLSVVAADYLSTRRALGYQLKQQGQQLEVFVGYLKTLGAERLTVSDALSWAMLPVDASPMCWHARLGLVRSFARYLQALDPTSEVPPDGLLPGGSHRTTPYIYSEQQIAMLLTAAGRLRSPLRADTYQTLLALLVVTGMRLGEAVNLDRDDLDSEQGLLTIRRGKFGKARQLPLHPSTVKALGAYRERIDGRHRNVTAPSLGCAGHVRAPACRRARPAGPECSVLPARENVICAALTVVVSPMRAPGRVELVQCSPQSDLVRHRLNAGVTKSGPRQSRDVGRVAG